MALQLQILLGNKCLNFMNFEKCNFETTGMAANVFWRAAFAKWGTTASPTKSFYVNYVQDSAIREFL